MNRKERLIKLKTIDIYPVTCQELSEGRTNLEVLAAVLAGGAKIIQLREKHWDKKDLYELAIEFRKRTRSYDALLIINDHVDVALAAGADGVHLGQEDLPIGAARKIAPELIIGASSHNLSEALKAEQDGADYVNIGPIFPTKTKANAVRFLGPEAIAEIGPQLTVPFTTMGGINPSNIGRVLEAGARRVALITGITRAADIAERVRQLRKTITDYYDRSH
ncbi:MAG: thiamine-phosphate diphosphorylase [Desulfobacterales bacterium S5133MH16]|jgi:thiamine-phosphate pyrophosphorylase|nr:MAG: thiamine-phosphate diphosphorylase [Desulfobacterales bacterium S5133MH16]